MVNLMFCKFYNNQNFFKLQKKKKSVGRYEETSSEATDATVRMPGFQLLADVAHEAVSWQALGASASRLGTFLSFSVPLPQKQIKELTTSAGTNTRCSSPFSMTTNKTLTFESDPGLARPGSAHVEFNPLNQTWPGLGMGPIRFYQ